MKPPLLSEKQAARLIVAARELADVAFNRGNALPPARWAKRLEQKAARVDEALEAIPGYGAVTLPERDL